MVISSVIAGVGAYVPPKVVTNQDLSQWMDTSDEWIRERSGIRERRFVEPGVSTSDLGVLAAKEALDQAGWTCNDIDLILAATLSPDYYFPGIGVLLQHKLGCKSSVPALDIRGQCSGFVWSLITGHQFLASHHIKKILIVGSEIHSRILELSDRGRDVAVLFGDGAGAVCLERREESKLTLNSGIIDWDMGSDGAGASMLAVKRPGLAGEANFLNQKDLDEKTWIPHMEGRQVFRHAVTRMSASCELLLQRNGISAQDIDLLLPHQANQRINEAVAVKLGLKSHQVFQNIEFYGNTTSATIPLLMKDALKAGKLKEGQKVLITAFGAGFTWGSVYLKW